VFLFIDLAFFAANTLKIAEGGWIPLVIGLIVFALLSTWRRGRQLLNRAGAEAAGGGAGVDAVLASIRKGSAAHVPGTAVYLHRNLSGVPRALLHNLKHNKVIHDRVIFLTVIVEEVPFLLEAERVRVTPLADGFWRLVARYGFMEHPHVPDVLTIADSQGLPFKPGETSYFVGRDNPVPSKDNPGMAYWRERLFAVMLRNATPITNYLGLTPNRVVELGAEVEI
jgi:KUP system potassium uptake protein